MVAGNGGDNLDASLPATALEQWAPAPGVRIQQIVHSKRFGFLLLHRDAADASEWAMTAYSVEGAVLAACRLGAQRQLSCAPDGGEQR